MDDLSKIAVGTIFAILQALLLGVIAAAIKTFWSVKRLKCDMNEAFRKIRNLEHPKRDEPFLPPRDEE